MFDKVKLGQLLMGSSTKNHPSLPGSNLFSSSQATSKYRLEESGGGNYLEVLNTDTEDAGQYRCSVSAYNKREIVHQLRIRGNGLC